MKFTPNLYIFLLAGILCSGCLPARLAASPGAKGVVVNSLTRLPIEGAEVFVSRAPFKLRTVTNEVTGEIEVVGTGDARLLPPSLTEAITNARAPIVITGTNGRFSIPPEKRWGLVLLIGDYFGPQGSLVVRRGGFEYTIRALDFQTVVDVGEIQLPASK